YGTELPFSQCVVEKTVKILGGNTLYFSLQFSAFLSCKIQQLKDFQNILRFVHSSFKLNHIEESFYLSQG
ncbi:hypothetical protein, partial [Lysinibacillus telephonicus]|uniref:hypothetical protein n=1 Tax=Lysinibacillus telephonicus TaxID=1714840 RepID=UPI001C8C9F74